MATSASMADTKNAIGTHLLSRKSMRTSLKWFVRMFTNENAKTVSYWSTASRTDSTTFCLSSFVRLSTFVSAFVRWRLDFGIVDRACVSAGVKSAEEADDDDDDEDERAGRGTQK